MKISVSSLVLLVTISVTALAVTGCSTLPWVEYSESKISSNTGYDNFAILPIANQSIDPMVMSILGESDMSFVTTRAILEERGYTNTDYESADFIVGLRASPAPRSRRPGWSPPGSNNEIHGVSSTPSRPIWRLSVEIFDKETNDLVWSGWTDTPYINIYEKETNRFRIIEMILEEFPN